MQYKFIAMDLGRGNARKCPNFRNLTNGVDHTLAHWLLRLFFDSWHDSTALHDPFVVSKVD